VTKLLQRLHDELVRRHYAATTRDSYLKIVTAFSRHVGRRLDRVGPDDLRRYPVFLLEERKLAVGTVVAQIAALRFFFVRVLKRRDMKEDLPYPKHRRRLPVVLSPDEVQRLIAGAKNLYHRTLLLTLYGAGLRRSEVCRLKVRDTRDHGRLHRRADPRVRSRVSRIQQPAPDRASPNRTLTRPCPRRRRSRVAACPIDRSPRAGILIPAP
jgi:integrase